VAAALSHPYVDEGRLRYHTCMCQCCPNSPDGVRYTSDAEPVCSTPFHYVFEDELNSISRVKGLCYVLCAEYYLLSTFACNWCSLSFFAWPFTVHIITGLMLKGGKWWCVLCRQVESTVHRCPVSASRISSTQRQFTTLQKICKVLSCFSV